jgi:hypothetical protein
MTPLPPEAVHITFEPPPYRMAMGLTAQDPDELIEIDELYPAELAERRHLLAERRDEVFAARPGSEAARAEVFALLADLLPRRFPAWFGSAGGALHNHLTGEMWPLADPGCDRLEAAGRLVQEDLCIIQPGETGPVLAAAVLCFPTRWRLADKIGRPLADVHGPVPLYADRLARPVDRFMSALRPGKLAVRANWTILDDPALFQPVKRFRDGPDEAITPQNAGARLYLRVERQTLCALPESGAVLFGIRVHVYPLARIAAQRELAARLAAMLRGLPDELVGYKNLRAFQSALLGYLDVQAA